MNVRAGLRRAFVQIVREFLLCVLLAVFRAEPLLHERQDDRLAPDTAHEIRARRLPDGLGQCFIVLLKVLEERTVREHDLCIAVRRPPLKGLCPLCFADNLHGRQHVEVLGIVAQPLGILCNHAGHSFTALVVQRSRNAQDAAEVGHAVYMPALLCGTRTHRTLEAAQ